MLRHYIFSPFLGEIIKHLNLKESLMEFQCFSASRRVRGTYDSLLLSEKLNDLYADKLQYNLNGIIFWGQVEF